LEGDFDMKEEIEKILKNFITNILHYHDKECGRTNNVEIIFKARFPEVSKAICEYIELNYEERSAFDKRILRNRTNPHCTCDTIEIKEACPACNKPIKPKKSLTEQVREFQILHPKKIWKLKFPLYLEDKRFRWMAEAYEMIQDKINELVDAENFR